ncbi:hypothetical protein TrRE_jg6087, partial [Triparma retinervis]
LLPVPIQPHKGQSFAVSAPKGFLDRVLFAADTYIVPKSDGRIIVGATVEPGVYDGDVTVGGMMHCFNAAARLLPGIKELKIVETWAGLRPTTPDKAPIFGETAWDKVWVAGGYWRNGVLLSPLLGKALAERLSGLPVEGGLEYAFSEFKWDRFLDPKQGRKMQIANRYMSEMHPVYYRSDKGIASSVGQELGLYEGAKEAREERKSDRDFLEGGGMEAMERAAREGVEDARGFEGLEGVGGGKGGKFAVDEMEMEMEMKMGMGGEAQLEVEAEAEVEGGDLEDVYAQIKANKESVTDTVFNAEVSEKKEFDFSVYGVDVDGTRSWRRG